MLYGYALAYLVAPTTFDSTHVIEIISSLPDAVKYAGKVILAAPFAFHSLNGLRHLGWDMGKCTGFSTARNRCKACADCLISPYSQGCIRFWLRRSRRDRGLYHRPCAHVNSRANV